MVEQLEPHMRPRNHQNDSRRSGRREKLWLHRRERRRAKREPEYMQLLDSQESKIEALPLILQSAARETGAMSPTWRKPKSLGGGSCESCV